MEEESVVSRATADARVLGQLLVMQSIIGSLPDAAIMSFVVEGLADIPGIGNVGYHPEAEANGRPLTRLALNAPSASFGELSFLVTDEAAFAPYTEYLRNFSFMLALILEGRQQTRDIADHQATLEARVRERTEALLQSEETFKKLFSDSADAILLIDSTGVFVECNQAALNLLKMTREQFLLSPPARISPKFQPDGQHSVEAAPEMIALAYSKGLHRFDWTCVNTEGGEFIVEVSLMPIVVKGETMLHTTWRDITERKQSEAELRSTKDRLEATLDAIPDLLFEVGLDGRIYDYHSPRSDLLAAHPEAFLGKLFSEVLPPDVAETCLAAIGEASDKGCSIGRQYALSLPRGEYWFELSVAPKSGAEGQAKRFIFLARDITERKQAMNSLAVSERRFRDIVNTTNGIVWEADAATFQFTFISERAVNLLGFSADDWAKPGFWVEHLHPDDLAWAPEYCASCTGRMEPHDFEYRFIARDGRTVWLHDIVTVVAENGAPRWLRGIMVDVTLQKQNEAELAQHRNYLEELVSARTSELAQARDAAEAADRAKSIFLATMSHEMRTPMNGVMGMIDLALRRATDPKQIDWLNKSKDSARHLLDVINDILDISRLEAENMTLEERNFSLTQVVEDVFQMQGEAAQAKGLRLLSKTPPSLSGLLCGDPTRLRQILINFVGNAIKFSEHGEITVNARAVEEDTLSVLLRIEVTDQGIGISPEQQARLFHAFTQADGTMSRKYGGTGLGLSIVKRIALLMGGDAGVISEEGQGSTFWVTVRLSKDTVVVEPPSTANVDAQAELRHRHFLPRILVVDDEPINREIAMMQLELVALVVDTAEDGAKAVALAQKNSYAAIFMDMQMPKLNGMEATQQIRKLAGCQDTPIIAMTANAFAEDKAQCLAAGMNDFLIKPFSPDELFAILLRALDRSRG